MGREVVMGVTGLDHCHVGVPQQAESFQQLHMEGRRAPGPSPCTAVGAVQLPESSSAHLILQKFLLPD